MDSSAIRRTERERQVDQLVSEYYQAVERGNAPDQAEFIAQHPEFAAELRDFISNVGRVQAAARPSPDPKLAETQDASDHQRPPLQPGSRVRYFGDYEILEELGTGGMGVVYKARQQMLKRVVALKMIKVGNLAGDSEIQRFQAEASAAARLDHPNIVSVLEVGVHDGQHFFTMDYVDGGSLSKLHRDQPVANKRAAELVKVLADADHYAHQQGIVHRDLKPANVLLTTSGSPRITDFGLAKHILTEDGSEPMSLTETGQILGTAGYMSPEQAAGKTRLVSTPTDIYSLGAILYALLTGRAPFIGESQADTILQVLQREPVSPRTLNPSIARDLETIALKCLDKEPHRRYGTAQLLADDLARYLDGRPVLARPISRPERLWRWCNRNPLAAALSAVATLFIATLAVGGPVWALREANLTALATEQSILAERRAEETQAAARNMSGWQEKAEAERNKAEQRLYARQITLALAAVEQRDIGAANNALRACSAELRGWEYDLVQLLLHLDPVIHRAAKRVLPGSGIVLCVAFSADGRRFATGHFDHTLKIWDASTAQEMWTLRGHSAPVQSVAFSPDGTRIVSAASFGVQPGLPAGGEVRIWDLVPMTEALTLGAASVLTLEAATGEIHCAAFSPDGKWVAGGGGGPRVLKPNDPVLGMLKVWNATTGQQLLSVSKQCDTIVSIAFARDGQELFAGEVSGDGKRWNATTGRFVAQMGILPSPAGWRTGPEGSARFVRTIAFSPDGKRVVRGGSMQGRGELKLYAASGKVDLFGRSDVELISLGGHSELVTSVAFSPDGRKLLSASADGTAILWDAGTRPPPRR